MANELKFVCACKTTVFEISSGDKVLVAVHGKVDVTCTVCGSKFQYMHGTGGAIAIADNGGLTVSQ
jgi:hypothetical protein